MTVVDMFRSFQLKAKILDRTDLPTVWATDAVAILNNAQDQIVDELIAARSYDLLRPITEAISTTSGWDAYTGGINADGEGAQVNLRVVKLSTLSVTASTVFRNYIRSQSEITRTYAPVVTPAVAVANEEITRELIGNFETNGTNFPIFTRPKAILEGDYLIVLGDYYTNISKVVSVVVRSPKILHLVTNTGAYVSTCELPAYIHERIVDRAVQIYNSTVSIHDLTKKGS